MGRAVRQQVFGATTEAFQRESVTSALRAHRTQVVLAEYGPTSAAMYPVCREAGIPLVAHFHGVDAYHQDVLAKHAKSYPEMLKGASAVIGVSKEMVRQLVSLGAPAERTHHISCGVDVGAFRAVPPGIAGPCSSPLAGSWKRRDLTSHCSPFKLALAKVPGARLVNVGRWPITGDLPSGSPRRWAQARARIEEAYTQRQQFAAIQQLLEQAVRG
ncbi:MAG: glycosyltransferase [Flavobacteriales bacterium]|nr:glycosyltransferase [Flavobacteriales bacterium]